MFRPRRSRTGISVEPTLCSNENGAEELISDSSAQFSLTEKEERHSKEGPDWGSLLGGAVTALMENPSTITRWALTSLHVGILYVIGKAVWQAAQDVLQELAVDDPALALKPKVVRQVLEAIENQDTPVCTPVDLGLYRIAHRLHSVTGWSLFENTALPQQQSVEALLLSLTKPEIQILEQCLHTPTQDGRDLWNRIHGIPDIQQSLLDRVGSVRFCPQHNPFASVLQHQQSAGILLYGPPGCGKTMLLQAVSATLRMPCLMVTPSVLLKKFVGETNQQIRSLFTLAQKLGDCLIVLDELDGLFRERRYDEHDVSRELKTEFLQWWDSSSNNVLVVGATNRPFEVDPAVLRRLSQAHFVGLPHGPARQVILQHLVQNIPRTHDVNVAEISASTEGFSPSDLVQLVRTAIQQGPLRDARSSGYYRPLTQKDLVSARQQSGPTPLPAPYRTSLIQFHQQQAAGGPAHHAPQQMAVQTTPWGNFYHAGTFSVDQTLAESINKDEGDKEEHDNDDPTDNENSLDEHEFDDVEDEDGGND
jgi:hypothetical protein